MSEILVVDPRGDQLKLYIREVRHAVPFTQIEKKNVVYELSTGERVQSVDNETFKSASTGAMFVRVRD